MAAVEFARPSSQPLLRSTLDILPTAHLITFNTFREDGSGGCRVCSTPISSFSSVHSRHLTNGAFSRVQHLSKGREWWLSSLLDPHLVLFFGTLSTSHQRHVQSRSTPFERMGVAAVEFARPPSRPPSVDSRHLTNSAFIMFNTFREDGSGGCRVCLTPISSFSSVHFRHLTNGVFSHVQHLSKGREWWLSSLLDPHLVLFFGTLSTSYQRRVQLRSTPFERTRVAAVEFARPPSRPLLRSTLDIPPTARSIMFDTFERMGVAAVEFARPPSCSLLWSTLDIPQAARSIIFNTCRTGMAAMATATLFHCALTPTYQH